MATKGDDAMTVAGDMTGAMTARDALRWRCLHAITPSLMTKTIMRP
jgi:hypothetical protein